MAIHFCKIITVENILKNPKKELSEENPVKAYKLTIDRGPQFDPGHLTVVSAIAHLFKPEELLGKITTFELDLPPAMIRGFESQAMIHLKEPEGNLILGEEFSRFGTRI